MHPKRAITAFYPFRWLSYSLFIVSACWL
uniref:Uncharacterized protein n=1 Tax=Aeromonas hydrophila TaxID=644 RepID=K4NCD8_AERHY|nr:hypothetical protein [Aeromonas hydrophila]